MRVFLNNKFYMIFDMDADTKLVIILILSIIIVVLAIYLLYLFVFKNKKMVTTKIEQEDFTDTKPALIENKDIKVIDPAFEPRIRKKSFRKVSLNQNKNQEQLYIKYNYSFKARLILAPKESQERFNALKNYILSFQGVNVNESWKYERFSFKGKPILKIWIHGNIMKVYYNLSPSEFYYTKYNISNVSYAAIHETTPTLLKVSSKLGLEHACELVNLYMKSISKQDSVKNINFIPSYKTKELLIEEGLIKLNDRK
ncbi:hypothetical protein BN85408230 [Alteracholeplasma palmae J233]|uniref:Uncharacterized protein n=1 Tax=Alteracholeplasma palmae (strain ATCC 49389 / J233) TaxID=1318466 RepID=U4KQ23_ALTPJ|nr:hypothetical protein [Alteracholeplasma palmae]CCV64400.1 hypothetical protein BN85408230 [Alteracholeplasma palmae J233]